MTQKVMDSTYLRKVALVSRETVSWDQKATENNFWCATSNNTTYNEDIFSAYKYTENSAQCSLIYVHCQNFTFHFQTYGKY